MNEKLIETLTKLPKQAEEALNQSNHFLESVNKTWEEAQDQEFEDFDKMRMFQLMLQYRLDTQNALNQLSCVQRDLLQLLGIEAQNSLQVTLDRLAYAIGSDDLHHVLSMLNQLVDSLLRLLAHKLQQISLDRKRALARRKSLQYVDVLVNDLVQATEHQKTFTEHMSHLHLALENIEGAPSPGVILDCIMGLEGPISRFHQAIQHGLILSGSLYQQLHRDSKLELQISAAMEKSNQLLHQLKSQPTSPRLFIPSKKITSDVRLEQRATEKRLGNFFSHESTLKPKF